MPRWNMTEPKVYFGFAMATVTVRVYAYYDKKVVSSLSDETSCPMF